MFLDEITIKVIAGKGGDGCTSFRREKYIPMGGPDGGSGGRGANIVFKVDRNLKTLIDLRYQKIIKGDKGTNGKGSSRNGSNAEDVIIKVPAGTTIRDLNTNLVIADLIKDDEEFIVAHGGRGGRGNKAFATNQDTAPKFSEYGEPGEERHLKVELKVLADVGLVGLPSVGKSTFLSVISSSKPKIAEYHFTTLSPNLGVVNLNDGRKFVMADLPGLIEGASEGTGLGHKFLKHASRTRIIAHIIDMGAFEGRNPIDDYKIIRTELEKYSDKLSSKKEIVIANKSDLPNFKENFENFVNEFPEIEIYPISSITNDGINAVLERMADLLDEIDITDIYKDEEYESHVLYKYDDAKPFEIKNDNGVWVLSGKEIEKLFAMTKFTEEEGVLRFSRKLKGMGVDEELLKHGAKYGDDVQILDYIFTFKD